MTHTHAKGQGQRSVGNRWTDRRMNAIALGMYRISGSGSGWPDIRPFL